MMAVLLASVVLTPMPRLLGRSIDIAFPPAGATEVVTLSDFNPGAPFQEVIPSWNVKNVGQSTLVFELRGIRNGSPTKWYRMADWNVRPGEKSRRSTEGQSDGDADVLTDTLKFKRAMSSVDVRVTLTGGGGSASALDLITLAFSNEPQDDPAATTQNRAWGKVLAVEKRCQGNYPNGGVLCSATSTSMLLHEAAKDTNQPIDQDVPAVVEGLWDSVYEGAGNWSFNAAYYGQFPGLRGYIARFASMAELEEFIDAGIPVAVSVDYNRLKGTPKATESGHLVVLVGFSPSGDPVFNDPAVKNEITTTYKRADFDSAWKRSGRTVYVFTPKNAPIPASTGRWLGKED